MKRNYVGIVDKIKLISAFPDMLVRFTLMTHNETINCLASDRQLANKLLFLENGKTEIALFGHANRRGQLVVEKMMVRNPTSFERAYVMGA